MPRTVHQRAHDALHKAPPRTITRLTAAAAGGDLPCLSFACSKQWKSSLWSHPRNNADYGFRHSELQRVETPPHPTHPKKSYCDCYPTSISAETAHLMIVYTEMSTKIGTSYSCCCCQWVFSSDISGFLLFVLFPCSDPTPHAPPSPPPRWNPFSQNSYLMHEPHTTQAAYQFGLKWAGCGCILNTRRGTLQGMAQPHSKDPSLASSLKVLRVKPPIS